MSEVVGNLDQNMMGYFFQNSSNIKTERKIPKTGLEAMLSKQISKFEPSQSLLTGKIASGFKDVLMGYEVFTEMENFGEKTGKKYRLWVKNNISEKKETTRFDLIGNYVMELALNCDLYTQDLTDEQVDSLIEMYKGMKKTLKSHNYIRNQIRNGNVKNEFSKKLNGVLSAFDILIEKYEKKVSVEYKLKANEFYAQANLEYIEGIKTELINDHMSIGGCNIVDFENFLNMKRVHYQGSIPKGSIRTNIVNSMLLAA